jgi:MoxR-like ATPase
MENENESFNQAVTAVGQLQSEVGKALVGQKDVLNQVLVALLAGGHVLIEGAPGLGKTLLVKALSKTFRGESARIQFTPDLMPSDICGHMMYDSKIEEFKLKKGPVFTNLLLADEINRASAKTQSALLEVMQEQQVTIEGNTLELLPPFMCLATQNPLEQEGTYPLPEAQLDRFLLKILIDYPEKEEEVDMVVNVTDEAVGNSLDVSAVEAILEGKHIMQLQKIVAGLKVDRRVVAYAVDIVRSSREWTGVAVGAGPRGSISLIRTARAAALLAGRDFVTPDDIKNILLPCLRHRIALTPALEIDGYQTDEVLLDIVAKVEAPRI